MKLQGIKLKGFKGIKHGLGVDQIELDLSGLSGLIAMTGANGSGKTTLIEQLQPFPQVVSRPTPALKNHVFLRDSEKELWFELNGHEYRSLVKIDAQSGRSEGYIWCDGQPLVDGKISSFTKTIEELFGSPDLFFSSVFAAQGAAKVSDLKPAEFKRLMGEFLRLDRYFEWEKTAKEAESRVMRAIARLDRDIERAESSIAAIDSPEVRKDAVTRKIKDLESQKKLTEDKIDALMAYIDSVKTKMAESAALSATLETERRRLVEIDAKIVAAQEQAAEKIREADTWLDLAVKAVLALENDLLDAKKVEAAAGELSVKLAELSAMKQGIELCFGEIGEIEYNLDEMRLRHAHARVEKQKRLESLRSEYVELSSQCNESQRNVDRIAHERGALVASSNIPRIESEIKSLERQAKDLERRGTISCSCGVVACNSTDCAFIRSALDAAKVLPAKYQERDAETNRIKAEGDRLKLKQDKNDAALTEAKEALSRNVALGREAKAELDKLIADQASEASALEQRRGEIKKNKDELSAKIESKQSEISDLEAQVSKLDKIKSARERLPAAQDNLSAAQKNFDRIKKEASCTVDSLKKDKGAVQHSISGIEARIDSGTEDEMQSLVEELARDRKKLSGIGDDLSSIRAELVMIESDKKRIDDLEAEIKAIQDRKNRLIADAAEWSYLKNATGPNGLRAIEIDATAPLISRYTNDLFTATVGPTHSIELRTQDDEGREVLLPVVTREDGSSEVIGQFSGGEKTWDLKALRLALTLVAKQKSGRDFRTAFADEEDGALDITAARSFIAMYREFLRLGGFESIFFISHKPECVGLADHRIVFNGGISIE